MTNEKVTWNHFKPPIEKLCQKRKSGKGVASHQESIHNIMLHPLRQSNLT